MLEKIKLSLRINNAEYDDEINDLINACKQDLKISGIHPSLIQDTDPLIIRAITLYVKSDFGYDNADAEKFKRSYDLLKQHLAFAYRDDDTRIKELLDLSSYTDDEQGSI